MVHTCTQFGPMRQWGLATDPHKPPTNPLQNGTKWYHSRQKSHKQISQAHALAQVLSPDPPKAKLLQTHMQHPTVWASHHCWVLGTNIGLIQQNKCVFFYLIYDGGAVTNPVLTEQGYTTHHTTPQSAESPKTQNPKPAHHTPHATSLKPQAGWNALGAGCGQHPPDHPRDKQPFESRQLAWHRRTSLPSALQQPRPLAPTKFARHLSPPTSHFVVFWQSYCYRPHEHFNSFWVHHVHIMILTRS